MPTSVINSLSLLKWTLFSLCMHVPFNADVVKNPVMIINWDNEWEISVISLGKRLYRGKQTLETNLRKQKPLYLHFQIHFRIVLCRGWNSMPRLEICLIFCMFKMILYSSNSYKTPTFSLIQDALVGTLNSITS